MFPLLIFGVALAIAVVLLAPLLTRHSAAQAANIVGVVLMFVAGAIGLFALFTGRANLTIVALIVLALTVIGMMLNDPNRPPRAGRRSRQGPSSDVKTDWLEMSLNHRTGEVDGEVVQGRFAGRRLGELTVEELFALLRECESHDPQSAQLLEAFLDRVAPGWRGQGEARSESGREPGGDAQGDARSGPMTQEEALDILGLGEGASDDDIREAHLRLMREHHPDRGGLQLAGIPHQSGKRGASGRALRLRRRQPCGR